MSTIRVYHSYYGCETGCCGHRVELNGEDVGQFEFLHPPKDPVKQKAWAVAFAKQEIGRTHPECMASIDWESIQIEVSDD